MGKNRIQWRASQVALVVKNPPANAGDVRNKGLIPGLGRSPTGGKSNPLQYSRLENPQGQRGLAGYSVQDGKESDPTEATQYACRIQWEDRKGIYSWWEWEQTEKYFQNFLKVILKNEQELGRGRKVFKIKRNHRGESVGESTLEKGPFNSFFSQFLHLMNGVAQYTLCNFQTIRSLKIKHITYTEHLINMYLASEENEAVYVSMQNAKLKH